MEISEKSHLQRVELDLEPGDLDGKKEEDAIRRAIYLNNLANSMLTLKPTSIRVKDEIGQDKNIVLDSGDAVRKMLSYQKEGNRICFHPASWERSMAEKSIAKTCWVWINKKIIGKNMTYVQQKEEVKKKNLMSKNANMSDLIETMLSALMNYIKTGEKCVGEYTGIRVSDMIPILSDPTLKWNLVVGFSPDGFYVFYIDRFPHEHHGVLVSRKFIDS